VLVEDLKRHGVTVLPVDINRSDVRCLPEPLPHAPSADAADCAPLVPSVPYRAPDSARLGPTVRFPPNSDLSEGPPSSTGPTLPRRPPAPSEPVSSTRPLQPP